MSLGASPDHATWLIVPVSMLAVMAAAVVQHHWVLGIALTPERAAMPLIVGGLFGAMLTRCRSLLVRLQAANEDLVEALASEEKARARAVQGLQRLQRLETVGSVIAELAHDFRGVLTSVIGQSELLDLDPGYRAQQSGRVLARAGRHGMGLVARLESVAADGSPESIGPVVLEDLLDGLTPYLRAKLGDDQALSVALSRGRTIVSGSSTGLEQVLLNLVANSAAAMADGDGGHVRITLDQSGDYAMLSVDDDGPGVPEPLRARILEPFFTTRSDSGGTGLGLHLVQRQITICGGTLTVGDSSLGGAAFLVRLPLAPPAEEAG